MAIKLGTASPGIMLVTANGSLSPIALLDTNPIDPVSRLWSISYWPDNLVSAPTITNATSNPATFTPPAAGEWYVVRLVRTLLVGTETLELPICVPDPTGTFALPPPGVPADIDPTKTIVNLNDDAKIVGWAGAKRASLPGLAGAVRKALADAAAAASPASDAAPGTMSIDHYIRTQAISANVIEFGAVLDGVTDCTIAVQACHDALPSSGGTLVVPDGNMVCGPITVTKPLRVVLGRGNLTCTGSGDWLTTNCNVIIQGHSALETLIHAVSSHSGIRLTGTWAQVGFTKPQFLVQDVGFVGGLHGIDSHGLTFAAGFEEGHWEITRCRFDGTSDYGVYLDSSVYYSYVYGCQFEETCFGWAYIKDNTETRLRDNVGFQSTAGGHGYFLDGSDHVQIIGDTWLGFTPNTNSTVRIVPRNFDSSHNSPLPGSGIITIKDVKAGAERELDFNSDRVWIDIVSAADPDYAAWDCTFENIELDACPGIGCTAAARASNVITLTTSRAHGIKVGEIVHVVACSDPTFNGSWTTTSGTTGSTIKYANTGSNVASVGGPPLIASGSQSAIRLNNPTAQCTFRNLNFSGYGYWFDDAYDWSDTPDDKMGQSVLVNCKGTGPFGNAFREFKLGGRGFQVFTPNARSPLNRSTQEQKPIELRNRVKNTTILHASGDWTEADCVVTTGQTDSFGGTTAVLLTRAGAAATFANVGVGQWNFSSGIFTTVDTTGIKVQGYLHVELKAGTLTSAQCAIIDTDNARIQICPNLSLNSDWKVYTIPFVWSPTLGACSITICPGSRFAEVGTCYVGRVWVDDFNGDFIPTAGAMAVDTAACEAFSRDVILLNGTKIKPSAGASNYINFNGAVFQVSGKAASGTVQGEWSSIAGSNFITAANGAVGIGGTTPGGFNMLVTGSAFGVFGVSHARFTFGAATAGAVYTAAEQAMLQALWDMSRGYGFGT
jgi:hypothetical protein